MGPEFAAEAFHKFTYSENYDGQFIKVLSSAELQLPSPHHADYRDRRVRSPADETPQIPKWLLHFHLDLRPLEKSFPSVTARWRSTLRRY